MVDNKNNELFNSNEKNVVIIGAGVAGLNVVYQLMKSEQPVNITCITKDQVCDYSTCGMPYVLEGEVASFEDLILHKPEFFTEKKVKLLKNTEVFDIDHENKTIKLIDYTPGKNDAKFEMTYDILVIATGRTPVKPPIKGLDLGGVYSLMNYDDGQAIYSGMEGKSNGVIIGGGIIGLEVAVAFNRNKLKTTVVELAPNILPAILDNDMAQLVSDHLSSQGIKIITNTGVSEIIGLDAVKNIVLNDGSEIDADIALLSTGIKPNSILARKTGFELGQLNGIRTNSKLQVIKDSEPLESVYALGDCIESVHFITKQPVVSALASTALIQAQILVSNILGDPIELDGVLSPTITMIAGLQIGSVGLTSHAAEREGLNFKTATSTGKSNSRYYPGWSNINFKFLSADGKLIGTQIIGETDVKERINYLTLAIREGIDIKTILNTERCYSPPLALLTDPMHKALNKLV